ncbi:hypothetical protein L1987_65864 [Smallanthus sonchifolius]|uniref:Uncharacterized protein n=1 Tax=Smallanthus sonchifolius TaxID=185202 RepID=A0ACB9BVQ4_9ASTR|nr:hypothetical protein L1987_65864 [Smallanthus sonchifolius]
MCTSCCLLESDVEGSDEEILLDVEVGIGSGGSMKEKEADHETKGNLLGLVKPEDVSLNPRISGGRGLLDLAEKNEMEYEERQFLWGERRPHLEWVHSTSRRSVLLRPYTWGKFGHSRTSETIPSSFCVSESEYEVVSNRSRVLFRASNLLSSTVLGKLLIRL